MWEYDLRTPTWWLVVTPRTVTWVKHATKYHHQDHRDLTNLVQNESVLTNCSHPLGGSTSITRAARESHSLSQQGPDLALFLQARSLGMGQTLEGVICQTPPNLSLTPPDYFTPAPTKSSVSFPTTGLSENDMGKGNVPFISHLEEKGKALLLFLLKILSKLCVEIDLF